MHPGTATTYAQHNGHNGYYAPQQPSSYGPVYYPVSHGADMGQHVAYDNRKRGYDALNDFFGDAKRRQIDPSSYAQVGQRLMALQGVPMQGGSIVDYLPAPQMVAVGGGHGGHPAMPSHQYALPPMPNLRTKNDLLNIDQFLEQMQSTVYESPNAAAAAGIQQPGAHYTHQGINFRQSQSPPQTTMNHMMGVSSSMQAPMMAATSSQSTSSGTPALTPPSSTLSYTSGQSPVSSIPSVNGMSPSSRHNSAAYPNLPSVTQGYSPHTSAAPSTTLGASFDNDPRRRYSGGMLQRSAQPTLSNADEMDTSEDHSEKSSTPKATSPSAVSANLDPALSGVSSPSGSSESGDTARDKAEEVWVENIRVIEALRRFIAERLERGAYDEEEKKEEESLYPVLRAAIDDA